MSDQQHSKFKLFTGQPSPGNPLGAIADQVSQFLDARKVAAKSIGTEYLESIKSLVVSLGYRDDEPGYPVRLECIKLAGGTDDLASIESQMAASAQGLSGVICHELFITEEKEFYMVFMIRSDARP